MTETHTPLPYECFQDRSYYDMWCVRRLNEREWGKGFHLVNGEEAAALRDLLNTRTENTSATEPVAWQDINSAPHDWTWILCWGPDAGHGVFRLSPNPEWAEEPEYTHWQPLPTPPEAS